MKVIGITEHSHSVLAARSRRSCLRAARGARRKARACSTEQGGHEQGKPEEQHAQQPQHAQQQPQQPAATHNRAASRSNSNRPSTTSSRLNRSSEQQTQHNQQQAQQKQQQQTQHNQQQAQQKAATTGPAQLSNRPESSSHSAHSNSSMSSRAPGSSIAHRTGSPITAHGSNVAAIAAIAFLTTGTADTLALAMDSASTAFPSWL